MLAFLLDRGLASALVLAVSNPPELQLMNEFAHAPVLFKDAFLILNIGYGDIACRPTGKQTEKAFQVEGESSRRKTYHAWLPKAAVYRTTTSLGTTYHLAKWFRPCGWTKRFFELVEQ